MDHIDAISGYTPQLVVSIAAAVEAVSTHVLASGIVTYAEQTIFNQQPAHSIREATGGGILLPLIGGVLSWAAQSSAQQPH